MPDLTPFRKTKIPNAPSPQDNPPASPDIKAPEDGFVSRKEVVKHFINLPETLEKLKLKVEDLKNPDVILYLAEMKKLVEELEEKDKKIKRLEKDPGKGKVKIAYKNYEITRGSLSQKRILPTQLESIIREGKEKFKLEKENNEKKVICYLPALIFGSELPSEPLMREVVAVYLNLAFEQKGPIIYFTKGNLLRKLGRSDKRIKKGGRSFKEIDRAIEYLAGNLYYYNNKKEGKKHIKFIGHFTSLLQEGKGKGGIYKIGLDPLFTEGMNFETGKIEGRHIEAYLEDLTNRGRDYYQKNIYWKILEFQNLTEITVHGSKLLSWAGASETMFKKRAGFKERILASTIKEMEGIGLKLTKTDKRKNPKDLQKWLFTFKNKAGTKLTPALTPALSPAEKDLIERYVEWSGRKEHYGKEGPKNTKEKRREQITNTIKRYGLEVIQEIFKQVANGPDPWIPHFWQEIHQLKAKKNNGH